MQILSSFLLLFRMSRAPRPPKLNLATPAQAYLAPLDRAPLSALTYRSDTYLLRGQLICITTPTSQTHFGHGLPTFPKPKSKSKRRPKSKPKSSSSRLRHNQKKPRSFRQRLKKFFSYLCISLEATEDVETIEIVHWTEL